VAVLQESLVENLRLSECGWVTREEPGPQDAAVELSGAMQVGYVGYGGYGSGGNFFGEDLSFESYWL